MLGKLAYNEGAKRYAYQSVSYRNGKVIATHSMELSGEQIYMLSQKVGRIGLLELLNRWNVQGNPGRDTPHGMTYTYIAKAESI